MTQAVSSPSDGPLTFEELQLAARNRGMPLEALRYRFTPTGLHYLLVHFDIAHIDADAWRLHVGGNVHRPLALSLEDLHGLPSRTIPVTIECAGNGRAHLVPRPLSQPWLQEAVSTASWTGVPLIALLEKAGIKDDTVEIAFVGADHGVEKGYEHDYARSIGLAQALRPEVLVAYEMNGMALPPQHGFPARLLVPGWYGMASVKWLVRIEALSKPFSGYQQRVAYRYQQHADDPGEPVTRMRVRALMAPPGFPDFFTRKRILDTGQSTIFGRAWSGEGAIVRVEFGVDGAWQEATLDDSVGPFAWRGWSCQWEATPGTHVLRCRATDAAGNGQPTDPPWNLQGMGNNLIQAVEVAVR
jgi:sulfane dehydrogenase subunit SoxC